MTMGLTWKVEMVELKDIRRVDLANETERHNKLGEEFHLEDPADRSGCNMPLPIYHFGRGVVFAYKLEQEIGLIDGSPTENSKYQRSTWTSGSCGTKEGVTW